MVAVVVDIQNGNICGLRHQVSGNISRAALKREGDCASYMCGRAVHRRDLKAFLHLPQHLCRPDEYSHVHISRACVHVEGLVFGIRPNARCTIGVQRWETWT